MNDYERGGDAMSDWITDRLPTEDDADRYGNVWFACSNGRVDYRRYARIEIDQPWQPIHVPAPYVKPKRWRVTAATGGYIVYDSTTSSEVADSIPTREAAERIAAIYEEVMP